MKFEPHIPIARAAWICGVHRRTFERWIGFLGYRVQRRHKAVPPLIPEYLLRRVIQYAAVEQKWSSLLPEKPDDRPQVPPVDFRQHLEESEKKRRRRRGLPEAIKHHLTLADAAALLNVGRTTLHAWFERLGFEIPYPQLPWPAIISEDVIRRIIDEFSVVPIPARLRPKKARAMGFARTTPPSTGTENPPAGDSGPPPGNL